MQDAFFCWAMNAGWGKLYIPFICWGDISHLARTVWQPYSLTLMKSQLRKEPISMLRQKTLHFLILCRIHTQAARAGISLPTPTSQQILKISSSIKNNGRLSFWADHGYINTSIVLAGIFKKRAVMSGPLTSDCRNTSSEYVMRD